MIPTAAMRRLRTCTGGRFLIPQIFGVIPVLSEHTAHVAATELLPSQVSASAGKIPEGRHHRGDADGFIQHHELQDLTGTLPCLSGRCEIAFVDLVSIDYVPVALAAGGPIALERPPKPMLSA